MNRIKTLVATAAITLLCASPTLAEKSVKIGMITTLSGGGASLGIDIRDGFELALKQKGASWVVFPPN